MIPTESDFNSIDDFHFYLLNEINFGRLVAKRVFGNFLAFYDPKDLDDHKNCLTYSQVKKMLKSIRLERKALLN